MMDVESLGLDIEELHETFKSGLETVREFQSPIPDIEIRRMDKDTGDYEHVGTIEAIKINFGLREGRTTAGIPLPEDYSDGEMKIPAHKFIPEKGDLFDWDGQVVEISKVYPERLFTVTCEIRFAS